MKEKKWEKFEKLVAKVQADMAPGATVRLNQRVPGHNSGVAREIDILIESKVANYNIKIAIECKDHKNPLNVKVVESIIGLMKDIQANVGVIVSASGFTPAALNVGNDAGLKLYKLVDTGDHDWTSDVAIPALCHVKNLKSYQYVYSYLDNKPIYISKQDGEEILYNNEHKVLGKTNDLLLTWWESSNENLSNGWIEGVIFLQDEIYIKSAGNYSKVKITANLFVEEKTYFRYWPVTDISGFEDQEEKGKIITTGFTLKNFNIEELKKYWEEVSDIDVIAVKPVITMSISTNNQL